MTDESIISAEDLRRWFPEGGDPRWGVWDHEILARVGLPPERYGLVVGFADPIYSFASDQWVGGVLQEFFHPDFVPFAAWCLKIKRLSAGQQQARAGRVIGAEIA